jgi:hypothetical protein
MREHRAPPPGTHRGLHKTPISGQPSSARGLPSTGASGSLWSTRTRTARGRPARAMGRDTQSRAACARQCGLCLRHHNAPPFRTGLALDRQRAAFAVMWTIGEGLWYDMAGGRKCCAGHADWPRRWPTWPQMPRRPFELVLSDGPTRAKCSAGHANWLRGGLAEASRAPKYCAGHADWLRGGFAEASRAPKCCAGHADWLPRLQILPCAHRIPKYCAGQGVPLHPFDRSGLGFGELFLRFEQCVRCRRRSRSCLVQALRLCVSHPIAR